VLSQFINIAQYYLEEKWRLDTSSFSQIGLNEGCIPDLAFASWVVLKHGGLRT